MLYRLQVRDGSRWQSVGLDCITMEEVRAAVFSVARGAVWRVLMVEC